MIQSRFDVLRDVVDNLIANNQHDAAKVVLDMMWEEVESTEELMGVNHVFAQQERDVMTIVNRRVHAGS